MVYINFFQRCSRSLNYFKSRVCVTSRPSSNILRHKSNEIFVKSLKSVPRDFLEYIR